MRHAEFVRYEEFSVLSCSMLSEIEQRRFKKWFAFKE